MLKIIGSVIIILTCAGLGFEKADEELQHLKQLEELKKLFVLIRSEISYSKAPFGKVFQKISKNAEDVFGDWMQMLADQLEERKNGTFQEVWEQAIEEYLEKSRLTKQELAELKQIGNSLGYLETWDLYLEQLEITIRQTRKETASKQKLYRSMGVMGGLFLVIILL